MHSLIALRLASRYVLLFETFPRESAWPVSTRGLARLRRRGKTAVDRLSQLSQFVERLV
jgi:hypothetical protein